MHYISSENQWESLLDGYDNYEEEEKDGLAHEVRVFAFLKI
jgi:hypothetical protein